METQLFGDYINTTARLYSLSSTTQTYIDDIIHYWLILPMQDPLMNWPTTYRRRQQCLREIWQHISSNITDCHRNLGIYHGHPSRNLFFANLQSKKPDITCSGAEIWPYNSKQGTCLTTSRVTTDDYQADRLSLNLWSAAANANYHPSYKLRDHYKIYKIRKYIYLFKSNFFTHARTF